MNRDNQQGTPTKAEIAWLAGVIEGKGSLALSCFIRNERHKSKPKIGVEIKLYNTDAGIIKKAVDIVERLGLKYYLSERAQKPTKKPGDEKYSGQDPTLFLIVKRLQSAYLLAKLLRPWIFGDKGHRLDLIIQYLARRLKKIADNDGNHRNVCLDYGDISIVVDFYKRFVKRPGHNRKLVEGLLNEYEQSAA